MRTWSLTIGVSLLLTDVGILIGQDTIMCEILNPLRKEQLFKRLMDGPSAWMRISEVFPFKGQNRRLQALLHGNCPVQFCILASAMNYNVAYLDTRLFNSGAKMALSMKDGEC